MGKVIAMGNMKGGVGKSTAGCFLANYLYLSGSTVCVIDCDNRQTSLSDERMIDIEKGIDKDDTYSITALKSSETHAIVRTHIAPEYDYTFIDLPGNLDQDGSLECYLKCDEIILLFNVTRKDLLSTFKFIEILKEEGYKGNIVGLPWKINPMKKEWHNFISETPEDNQFTHKSSMGIPVLKTFVKNDEVSFDRNASTSTLFKNSKGEIANEEVLIELKNYLKNV